MEKLKLKIPRLQPDLRQCRNKNHIEFPRRLGLQFMRVIAPSNFTLREQHAISRSKLHGNNMIKIARKEKKEY